MLIEKADNWKKIRNQIEENQTLIIISGFIKANFKISQSNFNHDFADLFQMAHKV